MSSESEVEGNWRILYRADPDAIVIVEVFKKKSRAKPQKVIRSSKKRLAGDRRRDLATAGKTG